MAQTETQRLEIFVRVNKDTKQLEVVNTELGKTTTNLEKLKTKSVGMSNEMTAAFSGLTRILSLGAITQYVRMSLNEAIDEEQVLNRLAFALENTGKKWADNKEQIISWGAQIQKNTKFSEDEAFSALERLIRVTGDYEESLKLTDTALGMSVKTGKSLDEIISILNRVMVGGGNSMRALRAEFRSFMPEGKDANEILTKLYQNFADVAEQEESAAKEFAQFNNDLAEMNETVGKTFIPGVSAALKLLRGYATSVGTAFATVGIIIQNTFSPVSFKQKLKQMQAELKELEKLMINDYDEIWGKQKKKENARKNSDREINLRLRNQETEDAERAAKERDQLVRKVNAAIIQMEIDTTGLTRGEYEKRRQEAQIKYDEIVKSAVATNEQIAIADKWLSEERKKIAKDETDAIIVTETWFQKNKQDLAQRGLDALDRLGQTWAGNQEEYIYEVLEAYIKSIQQQILLETLKSAAVLDIAKLAAITVVSIALNAKIDQIKKERELDRERQLEKERIAEQEKEATEKAAESKQSIAENQVEYEYEQGKISTDVYIKQLQLKQNAFQQYSDNWVAIQRQIDSAQEQSIKNNISATNKIGSTIQGVTASVKSQQVTNYITINLGLQVLDVRSVDERTLTNFALRLKPVIDKITRA